MITKQQVSVEGYSERDLGQYYTDTLLLDENNKVVLVFGVRENKFVLHNDELIEATKLSRFLFTSGFYCVKGTWMFCHYNSGRGHKKSIRPNVIRMSKVDDEYVSGTTTDIVQAIVDDKSGRDSFKLSDRILVHKGKVWTGFCPTGPKDRPLITVGSYFDGELTTPYQCIKERFLCTQ